jgi:hypothetical protein
VEDLIGGPLAELLARGRDRLNQQFTAARNAHPGLDAAEFAGFLRHVTAPVMAAVHGYAPERAEPVLTVLYPLALELMGRGLFGPRSRAPVIEQGWLKLSVAFPELLSRQPQRFTVAVCNALHRLAGQLGSGAAIWIERMLAVARQGSPIDQLLEAGIVAAWRCGMAQYRESALTIAEDLPAEVAAAALGLPGNASGHAELIQSLRQDPWRGLDPIVDAGAAGARRLRIVAVAGGFRGWGGPFLHPPRLALQESALLAFDPESVWQLYADCFGSALLRRADLDPAQVHATRAPGAVDSAGVVTWQGETVQLAALRGATGAAARSDTLAVTLPDSYRIFLVAAAAAGLEGG